MRKIFFPLFFVFIGATCFGQSLSWVKVIGSTGSEKVNANILDAAGNQLLVGHFTGTVDFDPGPGVSSYTSAGAEDIFVLKLDPNGNFIWAKHMPGTGSATAKAIALDQSGNIFLTGDFSGSADFDPGAAVYGMLAYYGSIDMYLCKLDPAGNFLWCHRLGVGFNDSGNALAVDASGNVFLGGSAGGTMDFDPGSAFVSISFAGLDAFIAKFSPSGAFAWVKKFSAQHTDQVLAMKMDAAGNIFFTGSFHGYADMDPGPGQYILPDDQLGISEGDVFVCKIDASGNFVWAKQFQGWNYHSSFGYAIDLDASGNVYTVGRFKGVIDIDTGTPITMVPAQGISDGFLLKLDGSGNFQWAKTIGGCQNEDYATNVKVDAAGNILILGVYQYIGDFNPGSGTYQMNSNGSTDVYLCKLNSLGNFMWAKSFGGGSVDYSSSIALDQQSNIYLSGYFKEWSDVDSDPSQLIIGSAGEEDIFALKLGASMAALPVTFTPLVAKVSNGDSRLSWSNMTESNVDYYSLERSLDGFKFTEFSRVTPNRNDYGRADYEALDQSPFKPVTYYRILSVEKDGQRTYTNIARVKFEKADATMKISPNPIRGTQLSMMLSDLPAGQYDVRVFALTGQEVLKHRISVSSLIFKEFVNIERLMSGTYILSVTGQDINLTSRFVVQ